ncbi:MAG TPA: maleylpyruvate isomerase family mycothiol-dependent enzyme [Candidatus Dormibacteraeota bacterium]|nr:maleylpyruvate isomerase family mycothiol-dependent enzyme [Candidatus Dormibacteraeota bacterium]
MSTLSYPELLDLIEDRSAAFREAASRAAPETRVPGCPDWSLRDLIAHLGEVQRFWGAVVAAGPASVPPSEERLDTEAPKTGVIEWSAASTGQLLGALRAGGEGRGCWTWWAGTEAPANAGAVARHQVQEVAVHARDAEEAAGRPRPLPEAIAMDGVDEFLTVLLEASGAWPHPPAKVLLRAGDEAAWLVELGERGSVARPTDGGVAGSPAADVTLTGSASDLVLVLYGRLPLETVSVGGDEELARRLLDWPPRD